MGRGRLTFKGDDDDKKKKKKVNKYKKKHLSPQQPSHNTITLKVPPPSVTAAQATTTKNNTAAATVASPKIQKGKGQITSSGTVVTGHNTRFLRELAVGDAILILSQGQQQEMRVITMCLSDVSLNLSSAFSQNIVQPCDFQFINKPKTSREEKNNNNNNKSSTAQSASGIYDTTSQLVYREKTETGSYRIKREQVHGDVSRGDLLYMRSKRKSDKYC